MTNDITLEEFNAFLLNNANNGVIVNGLKYINSDWLVTFMQFTGVAEIVNNGTHRVVMVEFDSSDEYETFSSVKLYDQGYRPTYEQAKVAVQMKIDAIAKERQDLRAMLAELANEHVQMKRAYKRLK